MRDPARYYEPLDMRCPYPGCWAAPGSRCIWRRPNGKPTIRRPHAERVTAARAASQRRHRKATRPPPGWSASPPPDGPSS
jgi:hypothetical protein